VHVIPVQRDVEHLSVGEVGQAVDPAQGRGALGGRGREALEELGEGDAVEGGDVALDTPAGEAEGTAAVCVNAERDIAIDVRRISYCGLEAQKGLCDYRRIIQDLRD